MIDIAFVHFRAVDLRYFEAAWFSVAQQDLSHVKNIYVLFNDTCPDSATLSAFIEVMNVHLRGRAPHLMVQVLLDNHGDENKRCHSYSVNKVMDPLDLPGAPSPWVLFTRSDYILHRDTVRTFLDAAAWHGQADITAEGWRGFVTSHAYHHALDERADQRIEGFRDIEQHGWRTHPDSTDILLEKVNGWRVDSSHTDAGVWLTRRDLWAEVGGLNENLKAWGLQQTVFQQALAEAGVEMVQIPRVLFHHMHHGGNFRDYDKAIAELEQHWGPREKLATFRNIEGFVGKVCDELDKP